MSDKVHVRNCLTFYCWSTTHCLCEMSLPLSCELICSCHLTAMSRNMNQILSTVRYQYISTSYNLLWVQKVRVITFSGFRNFIGKLSLIIPSTVEVHLLSFKSKPHMQCNSIMNRPSDSQLTGCHCRVWVDTTIGLTVVSELTNWFSLFSLMSVQ